MADLRNREGVTEIRESRNIDLDGKHVGEVDIYLSRIATGLTDVSITVESDSDWDGGHRVVQYLSGWRPATDEEIREHNRERDRAGRQTREWQERQFAMLKDQRPDLFE